MLQLGYKDFPVRRMVGSRSVRLKAVPESKQAFLGKIDRFLAEKNRELVTIETHEGFFRVWYRDSGE